MPPSMDLNMHLMLQGGSHSQQQDTPWNKWAGATVKTRGVGKRSTMPPVYPYYAYKQLWQPVHVPQLFVFQLCHPWDAPTWGPTIIRLDPHYAPSYAPDDAPMPPTYPLPKYCLQLEWSTMTPPMPYYAPTIPSTMPPPNGTLIWSLLRGFAHSDIPELCPLLLQSNSTCHCRRSNNCLMVC